jgi:antitoxin VapB
MKKAKLFQNGRNQDVRLPMEFHMPGNEVYIKKRGNIILLIPFENPWESLFSSIHKFSDDFMKERNQPKHEDRKYL